MSRAILKKWDWPEIKSGYERGKDYNHSALCDIVFRGFCGVQQINETDLSVEPLIPLENVRYFLLADLPIQDKKITIQYDRDGTHYNNGSGLKVFIDGEIVGDSNGGLIKISL